MANATLAAPARFQDSLADRRRGPDRDAGADPAAQLHAKAFEILRVRTLAADEVNDDDEAQAAAQSCVAFKATPKEYTTCK
jgi:hypothetical protein